MLDKKRKMMNSSQYLATVRSISSVVLWLRDNGYSIPGDISTNLEYITARVSSMNRDTKDEESPEDIDHENKSD